MFSFFRNLSIKVLYYFKTGGNKAKKMFKVAVQKFYNAPMYLKVALVYLMGVFMMIAFFIWNVSRFTPQVPPEPHQEETQGYLDLLFPENNEAPLYEKEIDDDEEGPLQEEEPQQHEQEEEREQEESSEGVLCVLTQPSTWPVQDGTVKVSFGDPVIIKELRKGTLYSGIAVEVPPGTPVRAMWEGTVRKTKEEDIKWGKSVHLSHPGGISTKYGNMSEIKVSQGDKVAQGEVIGFIGEPVATYRILEAPYLHLEIYDEESLKRKDPLEHLSEKKD